MDAVAAARPAGEFGGFALNIAGELPRDGDRHGRRACCSASARSRCCAPVRKVSWAVTQFFRNSPWLVLLFFVMLLTPFQVRIAGVTIPLPAWLKATFGLSLPIMANIAEIVRGAVNSIPTGQWESAESLAFSRMQTLWRIILPQCVKRMTPPWMNWYAILTMATPLISIVGVNDAMTLTQDALAAEQRTELLMPMYVYAARVLLPLLLSDRALDRALWSANMPSKCEELDLADSKRWTPDQPIVSLNDVHKSFGSVEVLKGITFDVAQGRGRVHHRAVGLGQVDAAALHQRPCPDREGLDQGRGAGGERPAARQARAAQESRHGVPAVQPVPAQDGAREHHDGADPCSEARPQGRGRERRRAALHQRRFGWRARRTPIPASSRAASSSASPSPARSP